MKRKKHSGKRLTAMFVSCALCLACTACQAEDSASSAQPVVIGAGLRAYLTLPEMVEGFSIMEYGKIMEKGDVGLPDPELDPATNSRLYGKPVTFQVIDAIKGCEDGETITY